MYFKALRATVLLAAVLFAAGCGGGGHGHGNRRADVSGVITDVDGSSVPGATVSLNSNSMASASNGSFQLFDTNDGFQTVKAQTTVNGKRWSGETVVDLAFGENNRSINLVVSEESLQGEISGNVVDGSGFPLRGAKVFIQGPFGSSMAVTNSNGDYTAHKITPNVTYKVTCSLAGFVNDTKDIHVASKATSSASFRLVTSAGQGAIPAPQNVTTQTWTVSANVSRSNDLSAAVYDALKRQYRRKRGLPEVAQARNIERKGATRSTPNGSMIEVDLFWDQQTFDDLFGYAIRRGTSSNNLFDIAVARDPVAHAFFDLDGFLTPNTTYFYTVHALDTIDFPANGLIGAASSTVNAKPFDPEHAVAPIRGAAVAGNPTFQWTAVAGAANYQIYLFNRFPDLISSTDSNGVVSIWQGGNSLVPGNKTSQLYNGPALTSGHTYYWLVVAMDAGSLTFSASEISKFVKQ